MKPVFQLNSVSYSYHERLPALHAVNLSVEQGDQLVILGANGSGKSTLLKIMDGLLRPSAGTIEAFGEDVTAIADDGIRAQELHRRVGLVFQDADVQLFSPTVWDDVVFGPVQLRWPANVVRRHAERAMGLMGITDLADRAPYELSGGEQKRVAIASVLALDPEVLLLDEPTANLDPRSKATLVELIALLGREGKTVVTTTHDLEIVPAIAGRIAVFGDRERRPVAEGTPQEILADHNLLVRVNLLHEHLHYHGAEAHSHHHGSAGEHHGDASRGGETYGPGLRRTSPSI